MTYVKVFLGAVLYLWFSSSSCAQTEVSLSSGTQGVVEGHSKAPLGAVLLIHGWASTKDEVGNLFKDLAIDLVKYQIVSLRFDVRGESKRQPDGIRLSSTFASRVADTQAALDWLRSKYPDTPVIILGYSLGGATAMKIVSRQPTSAKGLVLWSTALNPSELISHLDNTDAVRQAIEKGEGILNSWTKLTFTRKHVLGMLGYNPQHNLAAFTGDILAIRGLNDYLPQHEATIFAQSSSKNEDAYYLSHADHIFNVLDQNSSQGPKLINLTSTWMSALFYSMK
jgi:pimeloyl-ACP methyl ester carboxylesterase